MCDALVYQHIKSPISTFTGNRPSRQSAPGFTLIELLFVIVIAMVMAAMAIPQTRAAMASYELSAAVDSASGAIQSTRYQAIMHGYPYQVAFNNTTNTFQVLAQVPPATTFTNVNSTVPLSGEAITLNVSPTFQFKSNGSVSSPGGSMTFTISYRGTTKTLTVSNYGSISVQ